jgi:hypothetical protein
MADIGRLAVKLSADGSEFKAELDKAAKHAQRWRGAVSDMMGFAGKAAMPMMAADIGGRAAKKMFRAMLDVDIEDMMQDTLRLGLDTITGGFSKKLREQPKQFGKDLKVLAEGDKEGEDALKRLVEQGVKIRVAKADEEMALFKKRTDAMADMSKQAKETLRDMEELLARGGKAEALPGKAKMIRDFEEQLGAKLTPDHPLMKDLAKAEGIALELKANEKRTQELLAGPRRTVTWEQMMAGDKSPLEQFRAEMKKMSVMTGFAGMPKNLADRHLGLMAKNLADMVPDTLSQTAPTLQRGSAGEASFRAQHEQRALGQSVSQTERIVGALQILQQMEQRQTQAMEQLGRVVAERLPGLRAAPGL